MSVKCKYCLGKATGSCPKCHGHGTVKCYCNSGLIYEMTSEQVQQECHSCRGSCRSSFGDWCGSCGGRGWKFYVIKSPIEGTGKPHLACNGVGSATCPKCNGTGDMLKCDCPECLLDKEKGDDNVKIKEAKDDKTILFSLLCIIPLALIGYLLEKRASRGTTEKQEQPKTAKLQSHPVENVSSKTSTALPSTVPKVIPVRPIEAHPKPSEIERPKYKSPQGLSPDSAKYYSMPTRENVQPAKSNGQNAEDKNISLSKQYSKVDTQLNEAYKTAMARLNDTSKEKLRSEQRNWIKSRDEEARKNPIEAETIKIKLTILRTRELERLK